MLAMLEGKINFCPCKYPWVTLSKGTINKAVATIRMTKVTLSILFPPTASPIIILASIGANIIKMIKKNTPRVIISVAPIL